MNISVIHQLFRIKASPTHPRKTPAEIHGNQIHKKHIKHLYSAFKSKYSSGIQNQTSPPFRSRHLESQLNTVMEFQK